MTMKKSMFLVPFLILAMSVVFSGAEAAEDWFQMVKEKYGGTTIKVSAGSHPSTDAFRTMVDQFTEETGIKVEWDVISSPKLRPLHFSLATAESSEFDVWQVDGFYISEYVAKDTIDPLEPYINNTELTPDWFDYEDIFPAYRKAIAYVDGKPYGVPTAGESRFIAYRKDLFKEHNIKLPDTTDELLSAAKYFKDEVPGVFGLVTRAAQGVFFASGWLHVLYQFSDGWIDQETGEILADSPEVIQSLEYWVELLQTGPPDASTYTHEDCSGAFMAGDAALWFDATAIAVWLIDPEKSDVVGNVGFLPPPVGPKGRMGALAGWNYGIAKHSKNKEAAWAFIVWMTGKRNSLQYVKNGGVLVRQSLLDNPEVTDMHPEMYEAMRATFKAAENLSDRGLTWIPPTWLANPVLNQAGLWGNTALVGDVTPEEACKKLAGELEEMAERWE